MKTTSPLRAAMTMMILSFTLYSCYQEEMFQKTDDSIAIETLTEASKATLNNISKLDQSEEIQVDIPVTKEMEDAVINAVKPVKEIVEKLLNEDKSGTYQAYRKDVEKLIALDDAKEKRYRVEQIKKNYRPFFQAIWKKADVDEDAYKQKIRDAFPDEMRDNIEFDDFLTFSMRVKHTRDAGDNNPPPPPPPSPQNLCFDPQTLWFGITQEVVGGLASSFVDTKQTSVLTATDCGLAGLGRATAGIASSVTIPGIFPQDDRVLRVRKSFLWSGDIFAISVIGCSFASVQYTTVANTEFLRLWAPVTWLSELNFTNVKKEEEYIINKRFLYNIRYGVSVYSDSFGEILAGSNATSGCQQLQWSECEEKQD